LSWRHPNHMPRKKRELVLAEIFDVIARDAKQISSLLKDLGPETRAKKTQDSWTRKEIADFEKAYKLHGPDVEKLAASVPNKKLQQVEAKVKLYEVAKFGSENGGESSITPQTSAPIRPSTPMSDAKKRKAPEPEKPAETSNKGKTLGTPATKKQKTDEDKTVKKQSESNGPSTPSTKKHGDAASTTPVVNKNNESGTPSKKKRKSKGPQ